MRCPNCGAETAETTCEYCGATLEQPISPVEPSANQTKICPKCKQPIPKTATVCPYCNTKQVPKGCAIALIVVVVLFSISMLGVLFGDEEDSPSSSTAPSSSRSGISSFAGVNAENGETDASTTDSTAPSTTVSTAAPTTAPASKPSPYIYKAGMYKVGTDIPAGLYVLEATENIFGYYSVTKDSTGAVGSIVGNGMFATHTYVEVKEGQYLEVERARFGPEGTIPAFTDKDGVYSEGMYKVGKDLPAGEYKVRALEGQSAYVAVLTRCTGSLTNIVSNGIFTTGKYVTVKEGQYLVIQRGELVK